MKTISEMINRLLLVLIVISLINSQSFLNTKCNGNSDIFPQKTIGLLVEFPNLTHIKPENEIYNKF